jgi:hypothetical protein
MLILLRVRLFIEKIRNRAALSVLLRFGRAQADIETKPVHELIQFGLKLGERGIFANCQLYSEGAEA